MAALFGIMYGLWAGSRRLYFWGLCDAREFSTKHTYLSIMNYKRLLFFFGPFGTCYLMEKKLVPEDKIALVYAAKCLLFGGFMILYLAYYPDKIFLLNKMFNDTDFLISKSTAKRWINFGIPT